MQRYIGHAVLDSGETSKLPSRMVRSPRILVISTTLFLLVVSQLRATLIWSDDFTGQVDGAFPNRDFNANLVNDWAATSSPAMFTVSTSLGNPAPGMSFDDTTTGGQGVMRLEMDEFATFSTANPDTPQLRVTFDFKVESFLSNAQTEAFRVIVRANNSMATANQVVFGFNRATLNDGDALAEDLAFYAASPNNTSNVAPSDTNAIGLIPGVGWAPGFDFGQYAAGDAASNDSDDLFYRFTLTYDYVTGALAGSATRIATDLTNGQSAAFALALNPALEFTNTDAGDVLLIASTNSVTGLSRFDNFVFESIPEPATAGPVLFGLLPLAARRRRSVTRLRKPTGN